MAALLYGNAPFATSSNRGVQPVRVWPLPPNTYLPPWLYWCAQTCPVEESEALRLVIDNEKPKKV